MFESLQRTYASESEGKGGIKPFQSSHHVAKMPINLFFQLSWLSQIKMMNNLYAVVNKLYCLKRIELSWKKYTYEQINHIWMILLTIEKWTVFLIFFIANVQDHWSSNYDFHRVQGQYSMYIKKCNLNHIIYS